MRPSFNLGPLVRLALAVCAVSACTGEDPLDSDSPTEQSERDTEADAGPNPHGRWLPCTAITGDDDEDAPRAECIVEEYPMHRDAKGKPLDDRTIEVFFKRFASPKATTAQLWLLNGGPGFPGTDYERYALWLQERHPGLEIFVPDHRGTGRSTLIDCPRAFEDRPIASLLPFSPRRDCTREMVDEWGEDISLLSVTESAWDVVTMIEATARQGVPVTVLGSSYGGYWLNRVLQVGGDRIDSAVFDSALRPIGGLSDEDLMVEPEQAGVALLEACADDEECSTRLGPDPVSRALEILDEGGTCEALTELQINRVYLQYVLANALERYYPRALIPAVLYRLGRCEPEDVDFIVAFRDAVFDHPDPFESTPAQAPASAGVNIMVNLSEIITEPSTKQELRETSDASIFSSYGPVVAGLEDRQAASLYEPDDYVGKWAKTSANILILQGSFDPTTPPTYGLEIAEHYAGPRTYYFEIEHASHGAIYTSHQVEDGLSCGAVIQDQFLDDPSVEPDGQCASNPPPFQFGASDEYLMEVFGHTNVWDNPEPTVADRIVGSRDKGE